VVPAELVNFFLGSVQASAALIGLLFVSVAISPTRIFGSSATARRRTAAGSAFTTLVDAFFVSLAALIPKANLGYTATIMAIMRLRVFVSSTLDELAPEHLAAREAIAQLRLTPVLFELGTRTHPRASSRRPGASWARPAAGTCARTRTASPDARAVIPRPCPATPLDARGIWLRGERLAPLLVYPVLQPPRSVPLTEGCSVEALAVHGGCAGDGHDAPIRHCV